MTNASQATQIALFKGKTIRKKLFQKEWWFSVYDVIGSLTDSKNPRDYFNKLLLRDKELNSTYGQIVRKLPLMAEDHKIREQICANTEGIFRIIQSVPSPKAEPFKRWLAKVGYERIQEIEDPELATKRTRALYKAKGYSEAWIEKRMRGIAIREELTSEWEKRGVRKNKEYAILTAEISKATFGMTPTEYKKLKGLKRQNLRDHMTDLEQIFSMLGEASTTEITRSQDVQGFDENKVAAKKGGKIAGDARKKLEIETNKKVSTKVNYLPTSPNQKHLRSK